MKLTLHCGTHKTATTTFQNICSKNRKTLFEHGILYPELDERRHQGGIIKHIQHGNISVLEKFFTMCAELGQGRSVLLSSEGFERCLLDHSLANELQRTIFRFGFSNIEWVLVVRDPFQYFESLYAELSKQYMVIDYVAMGEAILAHGLYTASNAFHDNIFIFDDYRISQKFNQNVSENLVRLNFSQFCSPFPGHVILKSLRIENSALDSLNVVSSKANQRLSPADVELNYAFNFLRLQKRQEVYNNNKDLLNKIVSIRIKNVETYRTALRIKFQERFRSND